MSKQRKSLKVISIVMLVLGIILFISSIAAVGLGGSGLGEVDASSTEGLETAMSADTLEGTALLLLFVGVMGIFAAIVFIIIGILGLRGAKNPAKVLPFMFFTVIGMIIGVGTLMSMVTGGVVTFGSILFSLVTIALPCACFLLANSVRKEREDLSEDELAGPDGDEYPDGYNPKKLGFMRIIEVLLALNVVASLVVLTTLTKSTYALGFGEVLDMVNLIFDALLLWFIWQRSAATRPFAIGFSLFNIIVGSGVNIVSGDFSMTSQFALCLNDIVILFYFITSRRAQAILVQPFSLELRDKRTQDPDQALFQPKTWAFWRSVIIYFCIFCVVGHWMEAAFCLLIKYGIVPGTYDPNSQIWHDWLYPFPVYGFGTVACILVLYPVKNFLQKHIRSSWGPLVASFVINSLVCSAIELVLGFTQNQPVNGVYPLWDYSDIPFNFMGQICLQNTMAFGAVATLMTWLVYPGLEHLMRKLPNNVCNLIFVVVVVGFAVLMTFYLIDLSTQASVLEGEVIGEVDGAAASSG